MTGSLELWPKGRIIGLAKKMGAIAAGCALAARVDDEVIEYYEKWIEEGKNGTMDYLARYADIRFDPRKLLAGAKTVISLAFPYRPAGGYHHPLIADYALGQDYHYVLKKRLKLVTDFMCENYGAVSRICVDTAPILERYWAAKSGVGFVGRNRQLIVPGVGSGVFLAEIVTTLPLTPDICSGDECDDCRACVKACPGGALSEGFDANRCRSYLSIEYRGALESPLGRCVYGCDICQRVCPHNNSEPPEPLEEFRPDPRLLKIDGETMGKLTPGDWRRLTKASAMRRISLAQLKRNLTGN